MAGPLRAFVAWMVWVGGSMALPAFPFVAVMAGVAQLAVPLLAEVGVGENWEKAH